jgi:hypothetical protein
MRTAPAPRRSACVAALLFAASGVAAAQESRRDPHVVSAERLVDWLDLAYTNYEHGHRSVT